jgi:hypothetical protein
MVASFLGYFIQADDKMILKKSVEELDGDVEIVNWMSNLLVLKKGVNIATIVLCGSHASAETGSKKKRTQFSESLSAHGVQQKRAD